MTAAATDLFDLFNNQASTTVRIRGLWPIFHHTAATAFTLPWRFDVIRTSAIGTGGTVHSVNAAAPAAGVVSINQLSTASAALPAGITARSVPTGGATAATLLWPMSFFLEEGSTANAVPQILAQGINWVPEYAHDQPWNLATGQGIKVRQITPTASTGVGVGWLMAFTVV